MKLAKLVRGGSRQNCHATNQKHRETIILVLPLGIQHLASERYQARSLQDLDGDVDNRALVLISNLSGT